MTTRLSNDHPKKQSDLNDTKSPQIRGVDISSVVSKNTFDELSSVLISTKQIQALLGKKQFKEAEMKIQSLLKRDPESADGHYLLGVKFYLEGSLGRSIECLKKSLHCDPKHTDAAICLSVLYNDVGKDDEARKIFEQANQSVTKKKAGDDLEVDRKFAVKHLELGDLYFRYRRYDESIEEYGRAALLDPTTIEIRIRRAKAFAKKGFMTRAIQELQELKNENQRNTPVRIQLGLLHYSQGNVLDAELEWENVLEIDSKNREAKSYLEMAKNDRLKI